MSARSATLVILTIIGIVGGFYVGFTFLTEGSADQDFNILPGLNLIEKESENIQVNAPVDILAVTKQKFDTSLYLEDIGTASAIDVLDPDKPLTITNDAPSSNANGILFPLGTTEITWTAKDSEGNIGIASQNITVLENSIPTADENNKKIMIHFDDGFENVYNLGLPIFDKYNIKTTQFISCSNTQETNQAYMSWDNIRSMAASGHDIQSHSMSHFDANTLSQDEIHSEYGQEVIDCFSENGISDIKMVSFPLSRGWDDPKIINIIDDTYEFARGDSTNVIFHLRCNTGAASIQENCTTYTSEEENELNQFNRYNILGWNHDSKFREVEFDEPAMLFKFIEFVNSSSKNTEDEILDIPIVVYRRVVLDNSDPNPNLQGVTVTLLDAEMKYLSDNNFTVFTTKDLEYDYANDWITIKSSG